MSVEDLKYTLIDYEHEIAKTLAGLREDPEDLLQSLLADNRTLFAHDG